MIFASSAVLSFGIICGNIKTSERAQKQTIHHLDLSHPQHQTSNLGEPAQTMRQRSASLPKPHFVSPKSLKTVQMPVICFALLPYDKKKPPEKAQVGQVFTTSKPLKLYIREGKA